MIFCNLQKHVIEILYKTFGTENTFDSNEAIDALRESSLFIRGQSISNTRGYLTMLRQSGVLLTVGQVKSKGRLSINQLNRAFMEKHIQLSRMLDNTREELGSSQKASSSDVKDVDVQPDVRYFIADVMFKTLDEAIEHCKKHLIKVKHAKVIWE